MAKMLASVPFAVVFGVALVTAGAAIATSTRGSALSGVPLALAACGAGTYIGMAIRLRRKRRR